MKDTHTLTRHRDIQDWVSSRSGQPALARVSEISGEIRSRLMLSFEKDRRKPDSMQCVDDGISPCSWTAWLAELDRQHLALRVTDSRKPSFEFVGRSTIVSQMN